MSKTRQQAISDAIAARIMRNTRKRFSTLHADALQEISMSHDVQHPLTDAEIAAKKLESYNAVIARIEALEAAVAKLQSEKKN